ncbi:hypothetical protein C4K24_1929 [Pseudomonas chlororaphis subsp. aurantiaca]|uniref:hypothetical protein n=1 Tax=Pseudomonas chlororaphis TaxID=587753 RepID=UPI000F55E55C|nr:hypothetical protein [Pseudomonas chlororaphis]AZD21242.1 hypothetical protein C4K24_1929 [Pseudomonas chlororaphis subsp. aurantiaca]
MIKKTTANEWTQAAKAPGTLLKHRKRGNTYSFTVIDALSGQVLGVALCDGQSGREDFLLETHQAHLENGHEISSGELLSTIGRDTWKQGIHVTAFA